MKHVEVYIDGACSGNPGPGGWGALLRYGTIEKTIFGGEEQTTNNRMELTAAISALNCLKYPCKVDLYTDSVYVQKGISQWIYEWEQNGWLNSQKKSIKNVELWQKLAKAKNKHTVTLHWIKGHAGHKENEQVDKLAREALIAFKKPSKVSKS
ncbi:Ribonuclease HI [Liberibacter crescens BT-1]|uniref:Ribonuclease H n=1 Tax=Liberibacter crescens (strain BT-1) TaxID=1215343 RepID=L0ET71_LIBCB|nr:ribonuclease HI [Liberibacter crescens]AGA64010.1 Ribonuclease HI [Liberibacter crescens BT-1]AMC12320.1 ribonuclease H [Liberibacter crescens]